MEEHMSKQKKYVFLYLVLHKLTKSKKDVVSWLRRKMRTGLWLEIKRYKYP